MGWFVLNKYYSITSETPAYAAALLLDPSRRVKYINKMWPEEWRAPAITAARRLWEEKYAATDNPVPDGAFQIVTPSVRGERNEFDKLLDELDVTEAPTELDDFDAFIEVKPQPLVGSPLSWWLHRDQRKTYPRLSRMAIDILSIPPESADAESVFSGGRRTLSWDRESMTCGNLEKVECIGNWLRSGLIKPCQKGGGGLIPAAAIDDDDNSVDSDKEFD